jgi:hypothetical protein
MGRDVNALTDDPAPLFIGWDSNTLCEQLILAARKHNFTVAKAMLEPLRRPSINLTHAANWRG